VTPQTLQEKWGSKEIWLRALFVRAGLIWLFRSEFGELELGNLEWLSSVLTEAYRIAKVQAELCDSAEAAFRSSLQLVKKEIKYRIASSEGSAELQRLVDLIDEGHLSDPLQQMFDLLVKETKKVYELNFCSCRATVLAREWLTNHPYGESAAGHYPDPYHVNAKTFVSGDTARVELQVHLDEFDVASLLAVPALLTHELVCHAHAREDRDKKTSTWAEGVMDWTALFFFRRWMLPFELRFDLPAVTEDHGEQLWGGRRSRPRDTGRFAAKDLVQWLAADSSVKGAREVAELHTARFALQVNGVDAPLLAKDRLASLLLNIRRDVSLQEAVSAWLHEREPLDGLLG
jgi:hypothetical protein